MFFEAKRIVEEECDDETPFSFVKEEEEEEDDDAERRMARGQSAVRM